MRSLMQAALVVVVVASAAAAAPSAGPTPDGLSHSVRTEGATRAAQELSDQQFDAILRRAASGDARWLRAIADLRPGTDAARAEGIDKALSDALQANPAEVLTLISSRPNLPRPGSLCEDRAIEPSQAAHQRFVRQATRAVQTVRIPALPALRDQCLALLRPTRVLAGAAFQQLVKRTDALCPARGVQYITPGDLDWEQEAFEESLSPEARKRLASVNMTERRCASRNGLSCPTTATLEAMEKANLLSPFSPFVCSHKAPQ